MLRVERGDTEDIVSNGLEPSVTILHFLPFKRSPVWPPVGLEPEKNI